jgi:hypothetical protein
LEKSYNTLDKSVGFSQKNNQIEELAKKVKEYLSVTEEAARASEFSSKGKSKVKSLGK